MRLLKLSLLLFFTFTSMSLTAQTIESLNKAIEAAKQEIKIANDLLSKTKSDQKVTQSQLNLIQSQIKNRKKIVANLEKQSTLVMRDIESKSGTVSQLERDLITLKKDYAAMVYNAYKHYKLNNFMLFLFASKDFNDATRRVAYMRRYNLMREGKAIEIDSIATSVNTQIGELQNKKDDLKKLQESRNDEIKSMAKDETRYKTSVTQLKKQETKLSSTLKTKQNQINKLQNQIKSIIAEEARKNKGTVKTTAEQEYIANLSGKFDQNIGQLPFPIRNGIIVEHYGSTNGTQVKNTGVNIAGEKGAVVRSVFEGQVSRIFTIPGLNNNVMIRHGNYITVYANLESVSIKTGDKVSLNQTIGKLSDSSDGDEHVLHFEIWRETENLNPENWIRR